MPLYANFVVLRQKDSHKESHNVKVAQKPFQTSGLIFAKPIPRNDCDDEYIAQTKRQFGTRLKKHQKAVFFCKKIQLYRNTHAQLTIQLGGILLKIITTNRRYHQRLCLEAWHINSAHAPLNRDDRGLLLDTYLHLVRKKAAN